MVTPPTPGVILPGFTPQNPVIGMEDPHTPVQYKRATLMKLRDTLNRARLKSTAIQERHKNEFNKQVRRYICVGFCLC